VKFSDLRQLVGTEEVLAKSTALVRGLRMAAPQYTEAQVAAAAGAAMNAGVLSPEVCQHVSSALALGGVAAVPQSIMDVLAGK
jgi:hypothetical protein